MIKLNPVRREFEKCYYQGKGLVPTYKFGMLKFFKFLECLEQETIFCSHIDNFYMARPGMYYVVASGIMSYNIGTL